MPSENAFWKFSVLMLIAVFFVVILVGGRTKQKQEKPETVQGREYFPVSIVAMSTGHNFHTHVMVSGKVALIVPKEDDRDTHIRLVDGNAFIVAECIPELPCFHPKVGQTITVKGISRFDEEHKWYEVHPVESLTVQ